MTIRTPIGSPLTWVRAALFVSLFLAAGAANAAGPSRPFQIGLWSGGAWTNDQTGAFSHCAASVPYQSGITMFAAVNRSYSWSLGFGDPRWTLAQEPRSR